MRFIFMLTIVLWGGMSGAAAQCDEAAARNVTTQWGHSTIVGIKRGQAKALRGLVSLADGEVLPGVLVEVFEHPESTSFGEPTHSGERIAACVTGKDGKFSFQTQEGRYELRASKPGWNTTCLIVEIRKRGQRKSLRVVMHIGT